MSRLMDEFARFTPRQGSAASIGLVVATFVRSIGHYHAVRVAYAVRYQGTLITTTR